MITAIKIQIGPYARSDWSKTYVLSECNTLLRLLYNNDINNNDGNNIMSVFYKRVLKPHKGGQLH